MDVKIRLTAGLPGMVKLLCLQGLGAFLFALRFSLNTEYAAQPMAVQRGGAVFNGIGIGRNM